MKLLLFIICLCFFAFPVWAYTVPAQCRWIGGHYPNGYWQCDAYIPGLIIDEDGHVWRHNGHRFDKRYH